MPGFALLLLADGAFKNIHLTLPGQKTTQMPEAMVATGKKSIHEEVFWNASWLITVIRKS